MSEIPAPISIPLAEGRAAALTASIVTLRYPVEPRGTETRTGPARCGSDRLTLPRSVEMMTLVIAGCWGVPGRGVSEMVDSERGRLNVTEIHCPSELFSALATHAVAGFPSNAEAGPCAGWSSREE